VRACSTAWWRSLARNPSASPEFSLTEEPLFSILIYATTPINAAAVHSYVFHANDRTNYISELKAGSQVTAVSASGHCRQVYVGRVKTEIRPLLLIEVRFDDGHMVNIVMQDDWHVRIFSADARPCHITELRPGDKVLGFTTQPGRHVGVQVDEHIIEC